MPSYVMRIPVCSNEGQCPFPRGNNYEIGKILLQNFQIFSSKTTRPISTKLGTMHPWVKRIQVYLNEEQLNSHKVNKGFFPLNQHYDNHMCYFLW